MKRLITTFWLARLTGTSPVEAWFLARLMLRESPGSSPRQIAHDFATLWEADA